MCNRYVKFGGFYNWAMENGADFVATGHYAQIIDGKMIAGTDKNKDQTYFLWTLTKDQLSKTIFPVGNIEKSEVRKIARKFNLPNAEKKDSQGLCFIGKIDIKEFLSHYIEPKIGDVINENGEKIGDHNGSFFFTIGERHGFNLSIKTPNDKPYYVISKDIEKNTITVANKDINGALPNPINKIKLSNVNWNQAIPIINKTILARSRYRDSLEKIKFIDENTVLFENSQYDISEGQSLVLYDGEVCLGGGIIDKLSTI
jgi:tRNA-specific 2-thiouridylase